LGLFDYVVLTEELAGRLGRYGSEYYQTKYGVEGGYLRVYNGFDTYRTFWEVLTWVELLVKPKSLEVASTAPSMSTVKLEDLGSVEKAEVSVRLSADVYSLDEITELLKKLGFDGPRESKDEVLEEVREELGYWSFDSPIELSMVRIEDESSPLGFDVVLKLKSKKYEVTVPANAVIRVVGRNLIIEKRELVWRKRRVSTWSKSEVLGRLTASVIVKVIHRMDLAHDYGLRIEASVTTDPEVTEAEIDSLRKYVEGIAHQLVTFTT